MLSIYNDLARTKGNLRAAQARHVNMYVCGMTV